LSGDSAGTGYTQNPFAAPHRYPRLHQLECPYGQLALHPTFAVTLIWSRIKRASWRGRIVDDSDTFILWTRSTPPMG
jgi:hypothetical protein